MSSISHEQALSIAQQAVCLLGRWAGASCLLETLTDDSEAIARAKHILQWPKYPTSNLAELFKPLRLLFDSVNLSEGQQYQHYWPVTYIEDNTNYPKIPYPIDSPPNLDDIKPEIQKSISGLTKADWDNLSLLMLMLEKFGSYIALGNQDNVSLLDLTRTTAAVAAALANHPQSKKLTLIAGDLSGIQKFIYTISADGALKSLRARSFYLELVTQEVVEQLLESLDLPRTNVIYAGGGNLYLLASGDLDLSTIDKVRDQFNSWLQKTFQGEIFLALDCSHFDTERVGNAEFAKDWQGVTKKLAIQKSRKFTSQIEELLKPIETYEPCRVCHRDDFKQLKPLNRNEPNSSLACWVCRTMFDLGSKLFRVKAIARSKKGRLNLTGWIDRLRFRDTYYYLFENWSEARSLANDCTIFLINDWTCDLYRTGNVVPLLLGNYGQQSDEIVQDRSQFMNAREMAALAQGIKRVAYLRMDVDRLGQIFAKGLGENQTLPRLAGLSRQMSYFFKVYLNSLAKDRNKNIPDHCQQLSTDDRLNLLFIYAGGDDLFVSGTWNEIVEFAFDLYQSFRCYTGDNPDITLSGGISIQLPKFPLYQAAADSGKAEEAAKDNGRDSLGMFDQVFKWDEWLGFDDSSDLLPLEDDIKHYLKSEAKPPLWGIFPIVKCLVDQKIEINYARSFVQNLLATAKTQEQMIKEIEDERKAKLYDRHIEDIRYYLHLPRIAYALARFPSHIKDSKEFETVRPSLKNPYNAPYFRAIATWLELLNRSQ